MTLGSSSSLPDPDLPSDLGSSLWQGCVEQLAQELPEQQFNTWIKPLHAVAASDLSKLTILVGNRFKLDWIRAQYAARITALVEQLNGQPITVELALAPKEPVVRSSFSRISTESEILPERFQAPEESMSTGFRSRLNSALTFSSLVEGTANRMARAAAMHVASIPGQLYNPLFIYGGVGLGKTHLMHAVGNKLLEDRPDAKVLYIHAEQFVSDVVKAYQRKTFDEFKAHYHSLDLLLIDDVQFFANKERTQEEFFNAFEALLAKKSHIVMTSDTYPKGLNDIHERLISRFDSGLTVAIEPPELEMRVAILISKARSEGTEMPRKWPSLSLKMCAPTCASWKALCAKFWRIQGLTKKKYRFNWRGMRCAICYPFKTGKFPLKTFKKQWPTTTKSRSLTCIPKNGLLQLLGHDKLPCIWPKN